MKEEKKASLGMKKCRLSIEEPPNYSTIDSSIISPPLPQAKHRISIEANLTQHLMNLQQ